MSSHPFTHFINKRSQKLSLQFKNKSFGTFFFLPIVVSLNRALEKNIKNIFLKTSILKCIYLGSWGGSSKPKPIPKSEKKL